MNSPFIQVTHKTHVNDFSLSTRQQTNCTLTRQKPPACANVAKQRLLGEGTVRNNLLNLQGIALLCTLLFFICKVPFPTSPEWSNKLTFFSRVLWFSPSAQSISITGPGEPMNIKTECAGISAAMLSNGTRISTSYVLCLAGLFQNSWLRLSGPLR